MQPAFDREGSIPQVRKREHRELEVPRTQQDEEEEQRQYAGRMEAQPDALAQASACRRLDYVSDLFGSTKGYPSEGPPYAQTSSGPSAKFATRCVDM